jgi:class 3 adenylate cyclase/CHASE2 domain-containing sensor protein
MTGPPAPVADTGHPGHWLIRGLLLGLLWSALALGLFRFTPAGRLDGWWLDYLFATRQALGLAPAPPTELVLVAIDEATLREVASRTSEPVRRRWVLRYLLERLLLAAGRAGAAAVAVDLLLNARVDAELDQLLENRLRDPATPPVLLGAVVTLRDSARPLARFPAAAVGNLIILADADGKYRRLLTGLLADGGEIPAFALQACRLLRGELAMPLRRQGDGLVAGRCRVPDSLLLDLLGPAQTFETLGLQHSALDLLQGRVPDAALRGRLVFIGPNLRREDRFSVSLGADAAADREYLARYGAADGPGSEAVQWHRSLAMGGMEIQANAIAQVLDQRFLVELASRWPFLEPALVVLFTVGLGWLFWAPIARPGDRSWTRPGLPLRVAVLTLVALGAVLASLMLFSRFGLIYRPLTLLLAWVGQALSGNLTMVWRLHEANRRVERLVGPAVGVDTLAFLKAHPELVEQPRDCETSILEADLRGFTPLNEALGAERTVALLRAYYEAMWPPLVSGGGWVEKYAADSVMAAWNALSPVPDHPWQAVRAGVAMKLALARFNAGRPPWMPAVVNGIGIATGAVVVGNVGSRHRHTLTLIGDTANLAARLESQARQGELLVSEVTYLAVRDRVVARLWGTVPIRGQSGLFRVYEILGLADGPMIPGRERPAAADDAGSGGESVVRSGPAIV